MAYCIILGTGPSVELNTRFMGSSRDPLGGYDGEADWGGQVINTELNTSSGCACARVKADSKIRVCQTMAVELI